MQSHIERLKTEAAAETTRASRPSLLGPQREARVRDVVSGLLLLLLGCTLMLSPLWFVQMMYVPVQLPIAAGTGIALWSFRRVGQAMRDVASQLESTERARFAQSSLGVSLAMFYVVALSVPLTALLLGTGLLPATGMHLSATLGNVPPDHVPPVGQDFRYALSQALVFSTMLSFIGCSFYIANALRGHGMAEDPDEFDPLIFWAGLWFRLGQSILYTFCVFIYIWGADVTPETNGLEAVGVRFRALPLIGLFIGMFVRAAEALILGLAERTFRAVEQVVGPRKGRRDGGQATTRTAQPLDADEENPAPRATE